MFQMDGRTEVLSPLVRGVPPAPGSYGTATPATAVAAPVGGELHSLEADLPAVGFLSDMPYDTAPHRVGPGAAAGVQRWIMEIEQANGEMWSFADFLAHVTPSCHATAT
jgi:hypothetical protein